MWRAEIRRRLSPELLTFLAVGGTGYVVDVGAFNVLRSSPLFATIHPTWSKIVAVALAIVVTYVGNSALTWRHRRATDRRQEMGLFVLFNVIGLGFSVVALVISHDLLGLTSRFADNISANVIGLALGTVFRYVTYRRYVFGRGRCAPRGGPTPGRRVRQRELPEPVGR